MNSKKHFPKTALIVTLALFLIFCGVAMQEGTKCNEGDGL